MLRIASWNVNGIRAAYKKDFLQFIEKINPDILLVQETKALPEQLTAEQLNPLGYASTFHSAQKKGYSGVATFYKSGLETKIIQAGIGIEAYDYEGRFLVHRIGSLYLANLYLPSGTTGELRQTFKENFLVDLTNYIQELPPAIKNNLLIGGDFNICHREIDIHHPKQATKLQLSGFLPQERAWFDSFLDLNFCDTFRIQHPEKTSRYSWWSYRAGAKNKNLGWRIDYLLLSQGWKNKILNADILEEYQASDHAPIILDLNC